MSLIGAYDETNIFAKILRGEAPCAKVMEDEEVLVFMDIFPQSRGHALIVPKNTTARNLIELPPERLGPIMARVQMVVAAAAKAFEADGVAVMQFNGAAAGQTVYHLHFHVIPRKDGAQLVGHGAGKMADKGELNALAAQLAAALA